MNSLNASFMLAASLKEHFPNTQMPEIAFAGRSNVGKSSLLNSIVLRKKLAKISSTPGKTQTVNFFNVEDRWILVDMPGFGYAQVSKLKREDWSKLCQDYLLNRDNLVFVSALIDSRHDPMDVDISFIEWMETNQIPYLIVLTKCDKISPKALAERKAQVEHLVSSCSYAMEVLPYSAITNLGRDQLIGIIKKACSKKNKS
jgi:GTP-binding protein